MATTAEGYNEEGGIMDEAYMWAYDTFCEWNTETGQGGCYWEDPNTAVFQSGLPTHGDDTFEITFDYIPDAYYTFYYCVAECFDTDFNSESYGYDGVTEYVPLMPYITYNIGATGGQFVVATEYWKYARIMMTGNMEEAMAAA